jgi:large subunit ribosomal protein L25
MSKHEYIIEATSRANVGKGASRRLRHQNVVPAIIYGGTKDPANISMSHNQIIHMLENEAFFASIITMNIDGVNEDVVIKALQRHPAKPRIMHADFLRVDANKPLHVKIPLHFINEATSIGVKASGLIAHLMTKLEISCLPRFLPEYIEVDLAELGVGESLHISDLKLPEGVSSVSLTHGESGDLAVVAITAPKRAEEPTAAEAAAAAGKATAKAAPKAAAKAAPKAPAKK